MTSVHSYTPTEIDEYAPLPPDEWPAVEHLVTEDDTPVDNIFSEKQQRLLTESLYASWAGPGEGQPFLALANVGVFFAVGQPPIIPDVLLSLGVRAPADLWPKAHRSYFVWMYGKPPDVVIEIVSNRKGGEERGKLATYAWMGIPYYVIFDPEQHLSNTMLRVYVLHAGEYVPQTDAWFAKAQVGLTLWHGTYADVEATWLRWCDQDGTLIPTGAERADQERDRADQERDRADQERDRADQERDRADQERDRAERLAARLRELGIDPDR